MPGYGTTAIGYGVRCPIFLPVESVLIHQYVWSKKPHENLNLEVLLVTLQLETTVASWKLRYTAIDLSPTVLAACGHLKYKKNIFLYIFKEMMWNCHSSWMTRCTLALLRNTAQRTKGIYQQAEPSQGLTLNNQFSLV